ncbi:hypothetical protein Tco_1395427 [Tanacetum coccineum]
MAEGLSGKILMKHSDVQGQSVFTSRAWRRLFEIQGPLFQLGGVRCCMSRREIILGMGLHTAKEIELGSHLRGDFLGTTPSYTLIRDLMLRLCHRLIVYSIAGRSQVPEKVTMTDLFYLRGWMLVQSTLLIFWLAELVRLQIYEELDDTWDWVAPGLERQQVATAGAPEVVEDALVVDEGALDVPTPVQVPQPPPAAGPARTMA